MTDTLQSTRDGFGQALLKLGAKNPDIVVLSADLATSTRIINFKKQFPTRFFEVGVAEQNLIGIATGLALSGKIPFIASYAVFSPGGNWSQLRNAVYSKANIKLIGCHAGIVTGPDGASHQGLEDISLTRCLPDITIISPCDALEAAKATQAAAEHQGPVYLRLHKPKTPLLTKPNTPFNLGRALIMRPGKDITIIATGPILEQTLKAANQLAKQKTSAEVINLSTIKPLDKQTILKSVKKTKNLITLEDHQIAGGMGSAVVEMLSQNFPIPTKMLGIQNSFGQSGKQDELLKHYHLTAAHVIKAAKQLLRID